MGAALALFVLTQVPAVEHPAYERMSLKELRAEQQNIESVRPSLLAPIFMVTSGGVLLGAGAWFGLFALAGLFGGQTLGNAMVCLGLALGGGGFLTGGLLFLRATREERNRYNDDLDVIEREIELRQGYSARQRMPTLTVVAF